MNNVISQRVPEPLPATVIVPGADIYSDVSYLYTNVLLNYPESELVELATQASLDSKHFVKEWSFKDQLLRFICQVMPNWIQQETELNRSVSKVRVGCSGEERLVRQVN